LVAVAVLVSEPAALTATTIATVAFVPGLSTPSAQVTVVGDPALVSLHRSTGNSQARMADRSGPDPAIDNGAG
jgi:hypothetical protein